MKENDKEKNLKEKESIFSGSCDGKEKTEEVFNFILDTYNNKLKKEDLLIIKYKLVKDSLCGISSCYYLSDYKMKYLKQFVDYKVLIEYLIQNQVDFYNYQVTKSKDITEYDLGGLVGTTKILEPIQYGQLFIGSNAREKAKTMQLIEY